jgi:UDP:flavonoid glycosyltransferase YjiC (YdhE family)
MLALAQGLARRGCAVTLVASSLDNRSYAQEAQQLGIAYRQIPEWFELDLEDFARRTYKMNGLQWLRALLDAALFPYEGLLYETACELADTHEVLIGHHLLYPLKLAARQRGRPHVSVTLCPVAIPSRQHPPLYFPNLGGWGNLCLWRLMDLLFSWYLRPLGNLWRAHGQAPIRHLFSELLASDQLDLVAVDPLFCSELTEAVPHRICGFFNLEEDARHWVLPAGLEAFLAEGETPIYCTFGSLQQAAPEWSMDLFRDALGLSGRRAIIQTSSARFPADTAQGACYFIGRHPHQPVFERCRAVIHHGGAGTTHAATRAGCASIVVPFMDEQLFWGTRLQQLGIAPAPLPAKRATARELAKRIQAVCAMPSYGLRAQEFRQQMLQRDGVAQALQCLESLLAKSQLSV